MYLLFTFIKLLKIADNVPITELSASLSSYNNDYRYCHLLQGMYELPDALNNKFFFYLNILPIVQDFATYCLFVTGAMCLVWSVIKILTFQVEDNAGENRIIQVEKCQRIKFYNERHSSLKTAGVDMYFNDFLNTSENMLNHSTFEELANLKEDTV